MVWDNKMHVHVFFSLFIHYRNVKLSQTSTVEILQQQNKVTNQSYVTFSRSHSHLHEYPAIFHTETRGVYVTFLCPSPWQRPCPQKCLHHDLDHRDLVSGESSLSGQQFQTQTCLSENWKYFFLSTSANNEFSPKVVKISVTNFIITEIFSSLLNNICRHNLCTKVGWQWKKYKKILYFLSHCLHW